MGDKAYASTPLLPMVFMRGDCKAYLCIPDDNKLSIQVVAYSTDELLLDGEIAFLIF